MFLFTSAMSVSSSSLLKSKVRSEESSEYGPPEDSDRISADQFAHKRQGWIFEYSDDSVRSQQVQIFLAHIRRLVLDSTCIVSDDERRLASLWGFVKWIVLMYVVEFL